MARRRVEKARFALSHTLATHIDITARTFTILLGEANQRVWDCICTILTNLIGNKQRLTLNLT